MRYECTPTAVERLIGRTQGFIFDCDGVLLDSVAANEKFYNLFRERFGLPSMSPEETAFVHAHTVKQSLAHILPPERLDEGLAMMKSFNYREVLPYLRLEPGVLDLVSALRRWGFFLAINTNRSTTMDLVLDRFGLRPFFRPVITSITVANPKPHPESLYRILGEWGVAADETIYIGDSSVDEQTAHGAGVPFWAYRNRSLHAALYVDDFGHLRSCLARAISGGEAPRRHRVG
jgi:HAD superfamily hydrolase (TIGR01509 family)